MRIFPYDFLLGLRSMYAGFYYGIGERPFRHIRLFTIRVVRSAVSVAPRFVVVRHIRLTGTLISGVLTGARFVLTQGR